MIFLAAFSKAIFQNPCPKDIVYLSVHPCFYLPQNLLQLSQSIRGPYFYSIFLASWVHLGVCFVYAYAHTDFCFPPNASPYYFSIFNSCQFPALPQNNINQLGLVNHHLIYSCLRLYPIIIFSWAQPVTHYLSYLCFFSFISTPLPVVALLTYEGETIYIVIPRLDAKTQKGVYDFRTIIICNT